MKISPPLSVARIKQICDEIDTKQFYRDLETKYSEMVSTADYRRIKKEVVELRKMDRQKSNIIRRRELIKYLHDELNMPFYKIGQLLKRHHTSVTHLYYS